MFDRIPGLVCWKCGSSIERLSLPLRRLEECPSCGAELHVCRLCDFFDRSVAKSCREPVAEEVRNKERANFCDYFKPRAGAFAGPRPEADRSRAELEALFGGGSPAAGPAADGAEGLFARQSPRKPPEKP